MIYQVFSPDLFSSSSLIGSAASAAFAASANLCLYRFFAAILAAFFSALSCSIRICLYFCKALCSFLFSFCFCFSVSSSRHFPKSVNSVSMSDWSDGGSMLVLACFCVCVCVCVCVAVHVPITTMF